MRSGLLAPLVTAMLLVGGSALGQAADAPSQDGGLTVCCGGTFGYMGGSGGVSGRVVGPGGGSGGNATLPAPAPAKPSALNSGVVAPAKIPVVHVPAKQASSSGHLDALSWVMIALLALGAVFFYRKLPRSA
jgi:hypothetical protein